MTGHSLGRREPSFRERAGIGDSGRCRALRCEGASPAASDRTSLRGSGWALGGRGRGLPSEPEGEVQVVPAYEELEALPEWRSQRSYHRIKYIVWPGLQRRCYWASGNSMPTY